MNWDNHISFVQLFNQLTICRVTTVRRHALIKHYVSYALAYLDMEHKGIRTLPHTLHAWSGFQCMCQIRHRAISPVDPEIKPRPRDVSTSAMHVSRSLHRDKTPKNANWPFQVRIDNIKNANDDGKNVESHNLILISKMRTDNERQALAGWSTSSTCQWPRLSDNHLKGFCA